MMRLIGRDKLRRASADVNRWLRNWCAEVVHAYWRRPEDITDQFPNACMRSDGDFLFPVGASGYSVRVQIAFPQNIVLVLEMNKADILYGS